MIPTKSLVAVLLVLSTSVLAEHGNNGRRQSQHARLARSASDRTRLVRRGADGSKCKVRPTTKTASATSAGAGSGTTAITSASAVAPSQMSAVSGSSAPVISSGSASSAAVSAVSSVAASAVPSAASSAVPSAASSAASSVAASAASSASSPSSTSNVALTPNGNKAGIAGGDSLPWIGSKLGWWYDWSPNPSNSASGSAISVPMIWGGGTADSTDAERLTAFRALSVSTSTPYIMGFEEPDCAAGSGSAGMDYTSAANLWNELVVPHGEAGSLLLSPSMCHQAAESGWLQPFQKLLTRDWDITNIHVNKNNMDGVRADIDHYYNTYGKPIWVTEFACVDDSSSFVPCTDQSEIDSYISQIVDLFEADDRVYAYGYSDGYGLGSVWPSVSNGQLSGSGQAYLNAISKYH